MTVTSVELKNRTIHDLIKEHIFIDEDEQAIMKVVQNQT